MASSNGEHRYALSFLDGVAAKFVALKDRAVERGAELAYADDLAEVQRHLVRAPLDWGDPLYDYKTLDMTRQRGSSRCLFVYYAVNQTGRVVFIQDVQPNPYGPLADPPA